MPWRQLMKNVKMKKMMADGFTNMLIGTLTALHGTDKTEQYFTPSDVAMALLDRQGIRVDNLAETDIREFCSAAATRFSVLSTGAKKVILKSEERVVAELANQFFKCNKAYGFAINNPKPKSAPITVNVTRTAPVKPEVVADDLPVGGFVKPMDMVKNTMGAMSHAELSEIIMLAGHLMHVRYNDTQSRNMNLIECQQTVHGNLRDAMTAIELVGKPL
jgi:hypothetical protein